MDVVVSAQWQSEITDLVELLDFSQTTTHWVELSISDITIATQGTAQNPTFGFNCYFGLSQTSSQFPTDWKYHFGKYKQQKQLQTE